MLNLHCNKNGKNKAVIEIRTQKYGFKIHRGVHYAMELTNKNNRYLLKL